MKKRLIILLTFTLCLISSCSSYVNNAQNNENDENDNQMVDGLNTNNDDINEYTVTYKLLDYTLYKTVIKKDNEFKLLKHWDLMHMPEETLKELLSEYKFNGDLSSIIYEVEWYLNDEVIDENYEIQSDIVLQGKIVAGFWHPRLIDEYNLIGGIVFSKSTIVEYPTTAYGAILENMIAIIPLTLYNISLDTRVHGVLPEPSSNNLLQKYRELNIEEIIIPAELLYNGTFEYMFAQSPSIKKIIINGNVSTIYKNTFKNLANLESIIINGNVDVTEEEAIYNCPNASLIVNK